MSKRSFKDNGTRGLVFLGGVVSVFLVGCAVLTSHVFFQLSTLRAAAEDRPAYEVAQLEVKHVRLLSAVQALQKGGMPEHTEVLRCFSFLDEHLKRLSSDPAMSAFATDAETAEALSRVTSLLEEIRPFIDGPPHGLMDQRLVVVRALNDMRAPLHQLTDAGLKISARDSEAVSAALAERLRQLAFVAIAMIITMAALSIQLWRLYRRFRFHAQTNRTILGRLQTILDTSIDAIVVLDAKGNILQGNAAASALFDLSDRDGKPCCISPVLYQRKDDESVHPVSSDTLTDVFAEDPNQRSTLLVKDRHASMRPVEMSAAQARQDGAPVTVCFLRDVSRRMRAEAKMKQAHDRAVASEQAQARFLAMISHEMRTPLTGLLGTLDLLGETPLANEQSHYLKVIRGAAQQLLTQTNDALDLTQARSDKLSLSFDSFNIDDVLNEVVAVYQLDAASRGTHIDLCKPKGPLGFAMGDRARVLQVLNNLVSNAVKFTVKGEVRIEVARNSNGSDLVEFQIADTGIGIAEADQTKIFEHFVRLNEARDNDAPGSGLGLGIVRELVVRMRGEVGVESVEGEGSLFWVKLRLPACAPRTTVSDTMVNDEPDVKPLRILLAEDNETNGFVLGEMLRKDGHDVTHVTCGNGAISEAATTAYDLILMDIRMPDLDGILAARKIRSNTGPSSDARLVFLTAYVESDIDTRVEGLRAEAVVTKPLRSGTLRDIAAGRTTCGVLAETVDLPAPASRSNWARQKDDLQPSNLIDHELLDQLRDTLSEARLETLMKQFEREAAQFFADLTRWRDRPTEQRAQLLHDFAGSAATFGAISLQRALGRAEAALREGHTEQAQELTESLARLWEETRAALKLDAEPV